MQEPQRVQHLGSSHQLVHFGCRQHLCEQQTLQWRFGRIIDLAHLSALVLFHLQLHRRLKPVDVQTQGLIHLAQLSVGSFSFQARIAHDLTHDGSILLLYEVLIILEPFTSSRKGDLFGFTIRQHLLIDEFASIISIQPQDRKRCIAPPKILLGGVFNWQIGNPGYPLCWRNWRG